MQLNEQKLRALQAVELDIFKAFSSACKKLNVKYYLVAGTLLGAVRHGGFIPWDDDIDVGMPREDYEKFLADGQKHLPDHLFLQHYTTDPAYPKTYAKIRNTNTAFIESPISHLEMNHGVFIDIFPLDQHTSTNTKKIKRTVADLRVSYAFKKEYYSKKVRLARLATKLFYPTIKGALTSIDKLNGSCKKSNYITNYCGIYGDREIVPAEWYGEGKLLPFEDTTVIVPMEYDKILTKIYGDYMTPPPPEKRVTLHVTDVIDPERSYKEYL